VICPTLLFYILLIIVDRHHTYITLFVYVYNYIERSLTNTRCVGFVFAADTAGAARASAGVGGVAVDGEKGRRGWGREG
jgi:hypothetical protein